MKSIKDLKEMIKEPASKEWFAKHSKSKALEGKRAKEIRENNERSKRHGMEIIARDRHERRHEGKKGTSLEERRESVRSMSKDR